MTDDYTLDDWRAARLAIGPNGRFAYLDGKDEWRLIAPSGAKYEHVSSEGMRRRPGWHPIDPADPSTLIDAAWETAEPTSRDNPAREGDTTISQNDPDGYRVKTAKYGLRADRVRVLKRAPRDPEQDAIDAAATVIDDHYASADGATVARLAIDAYNAAKGDDQ